MEALDGEVEGAIAERERLRDQEPLIVEAPARHLEQPVGEAGDEVDFGAAGAREVAALGPVEALVEADALDRLGDDEVHVGVPLTVAMGRLVDRHAAHGDREVGAVVEVEAAEEVLVRLAAARVLRGDRTGYGLDQFAHALDRPPLEVLASGRPLRGGHGDADQVVCALAHLDLLEEARCRPLQLRLARRVVRRRRRVVEGRERLRRDRKEAR